MKNILQCLLNHLFNLWARVTEKSSFVHVLFDPEFGKGANSPSAHGASGVWIAAPRRVKFQPGPRYSPNRRFLACFCAHEVRLLPLRGGGWKSSAVPKPKKSSVPVWLFPSHQERRKARKACLCLALLDCCKPAPLGHRRASFCEVCVSACESDRSFEQSSYRVTVTAPGLRPLPSVIGGEKGSPTLYPPPPFPLRRCHRYELFHR